MQAAAEEDHDRFKGEMTQLQKGKNKFRVLQIPVGGSLIANVLCPHATWLPKDGNHSIAGFAFLKPKDEESTAGVDWHQQYSVFNEGGFTNGCQLERAERFLTKHFEQLKDVVSPPIQLDDLKKVLARLKLKGGEI